MKTALRLTAVFFSYLLYTVLPPPLASTETTYHIRPTSESPCPYEDCLTLSVYASETSRYFNNSDNLTLVFLPGEHVLNTFIIFQLLERLNLLGNTSSLPNITSKIVCNGIPALTLKNISKVEIKALTFYSCGTQSKSRGSDIPAIAAAFIPNFQLLSCIMEHNVFSLFLYKSKLVSQDCVFDSNMGVYGGAVFAYNSTGVFAGQTVFKDNTAAVDGGGIYAIHSELIFRGSATFIRNSALGSGGGVRSKYSSITFGINETDQSAEEEIQENASYNGYYLFENNTAKYGGGILLQHSIMLTRARRVLNFTRNWARSGGGIYSRWGYVTHRGPTVFLFNDADSRGGAVYGSHNAFNFSMLFATENSADGGGVLFTFRCQLNLGGVYTKLSNVFMHNSATNGGAIFIHEGSLRVTGNTTFEGNYAIYYGGGIYSNGSELYFKADTQFKNDSAETEGGGISVNHYTEGSITFTDSFAVSGGGICAVNGTLVISGKSIFHRQRSVHSWWWNICGETEHQYTWERSFY